MNRRGFLKFLLSTPLAATIDYEQLLWVPKPMIVVPGPPKLVNLSEIVAVELDRMAPHIRHIFERDDTFFKAIKHGKIVDVPMGAIRVPMMVKPGGWRDDD